MPRNLSLRQWIHFTSWLLAFAFALLAIGCGDPEERKAIVEFLDEPAGSNCAEGGQRILMGIDQNGDGALDSNEVSRTVYACDSRSYPAIIDLLPIGPGAQCGEKEGWTVFFGLDLDANGGLDPAEARGSLSLCDEARGAADVRSIVVMTEEAPGSACPAGGILLTTGDDTNGNGTLDSGDARIESLPVCHGAGGITALVDLRPILPGIECTAGGIETVKGYDLDRDGVLDAHEITETQRQCFPCGDPDGFTCARGEFGPLLNLSTPQPYSYAMTVGDVNNDGKQDIVAVGWDNNVKAISTFLGLGNGTFTPAINTSLQWNSSIAVLMDVTGDGVPDLIGANNAGSSLYYRVGNGDGTFGQHVTYGGCVNVSFAATGDFDHDGLPDLAISCDATQRVLVYYNNPSAPGFKTPYRTLSIPTLGVVEGLSASDLDGDGADDLVVAAGNYVYLFRMRYGTSIGNEPVPSDPEPIVIGSGFNQAYHAFIADVNRDGVKDIVAVYADYVADTTSVYVAEGMQTPNGIVFGEAALRYRTEESTFARMGFITHVNGDPLPDLILSGGAGGKALVLLGDGESGFVPRILDLVSSQFAIGNLNGDGKIDLVTNGLRYNTISVRFGL